MPFVTERWPGGMLTNFPTIRKAVKKMTTIDKMEKKTVLSLTFQSGKKLQISSKSKIGKELG